MRNLVGGEDGGEDGVAVVEQVADIRCYGGVDGAGEECCAGAELDAFGIVGSLSCGDLGGRGIGWVLGGSGRELVDGCRWIWRMTNHG